MSTQQRLMPAKDLCLDGFAFSSAWPAAGTIGGDYLAAFPVSKDRAALCMADISGKGLPAALLMSSMPAALKSAAAENPAGEKSFKSQSVNCVAL